MHRSFAIPVFLLVVLTLYGAMSAYICVRGFRAVPRTLPGRPWLVAAYWLVASSYILARVAERYLPVELADLLLRLGSLWLAVAVYLLIAFIVLDILDLANLVVPFFPPRARTAATAAAVGLALLAVTGGRINAGLPRVRELVIDIPKPAPVKELRLALATDMHMGTVVSNGHLGRVVDLINGTDPDLVLFGGDLVDEDIAPVIRKNMGATLRTLKPRYGTFGVTGNHEGFGGADAACEYLEANGVTMLRDRTVVVADAIELVGREDLSIGRRSGNGRKPLADLLSGVDRTRAIVLLDHQPADLSEAERNGVDLQLSGHTHNGQMWPFNYIVDSVFELGYGYLKKGGTNYYVSCGVGTWGPPVRTSSRPEIVLVRLRFRSAE